MVDVISLFSGARSSTQVGVRGASKTGSHRRRAARVLWGGESTEHAPEPWFSIWSPQQNHLEEWSTVSASVGQGYLGALRLTEGKAFGQTGEGRQQHPWWKCGCFAPPSQAEVCV